ncbi:uncharacterized protein HaLaN_26522, partial [Haematococcus lacustris]
MHAPHASIFMHMTAYPDLEGSTCFASSAQEQPLLVVHLIAKLARLRLHPPKRWLTTCTRCRWRRPGLRCVLTRCKLCCHHRREPGCQPSSACPCSQRIDKENAVAEKFWTQQATHNAHAPGASYTHRHHEPSVAGSHTTSAAPTGYTSKTSFLKTRLEKLEAELDMEREQRKRVETDLAMIK